MNAIFLDIETTGLNPFRHKPVEIAIKIVDFSSLTFAGGYKSVVKYPQSVWDEADPESIRVNGFTLEAMNEGKELDQVRSEIISFFEESGVRRGEAVFICQNPSFDRAFFDQIIDVYTQEKLNWPYHWLDLASMYWAYKGKNGKTPTTESELSKNAIAREFGLSPEAHPHRAMNGVDHLIQCYQAVMAVNFPYN